LTMTPADDLKSQAAEIAKKVLTVGVGAIFLTEESLRKLGAEIKLPKEILSSILESAGRTKNEFLSKLSSDVLDRIKDRVDPKALLEEVLRDYEVEFNVRVKFHPRKDTSGPGEEG